MSPTNLTLFLSVSLVSPLNKHLPCFNSEEVQSVSNFKTRKHQTSQKKRGQDLTGIHLRNPSLLMPHFWQMQVRGFGLHSYHLGNIHCVGKMLSLIKVHCISKISYLDWAQQWIIIRRGSPEVLPFVHKRQNAGKTWENIVRSNKLLVLWSLWDLALFQTTHVGQVFSFCFSYCFRLVTRLFPTLLKFTHLRPAFPVGHLVTETT